MTQPVPAYSFLLTLLRLDSEAQDDLNEALHRAMDWNELFKLAVHHNVIALAYTRLKSFTSLIPDQALQPFKEAYYSHALRNQRLAERLLSVIQLLEQHGIAALPFKGAALAVQAYGDLSLRQFLDLDLLVREQDVFAAQQVLGSSGYHLEQPYALDEAAWLLRSSYHLRFHHSDGLLELHWRVSERCNLYGLEEQYFWNDLTTLTLLDKPLEVFSPEHSLLAVCIHGTYNHWQKLKWIADVAYLVRSHADMDWKRLLHQADRMGFRRLVLLGLWLAKELLGAPLPENIVQLASQDATMCELVELVRVKILPGGEVPSPLRNLRFYARARERLAARLYLAADQAFLPKQADWESWRIPVKLYPLYYLYRPLRLALHLKTINR